MKLSELIAQDARFDVDFDIEEGDIVTDLVVLGRIVRLEDTDDALIIGSTDHTGGMTQYGIVATAKLQVEDWMVNDSDD